MLVVPSVAPATKKKVPIIKPTLAATKGKGMAIGAPSMKKFTSPTKPLGIVIGASVVPMVPAP